MGCARATVQAGVCGLVTEITARSDDEQAVRFTIASDCANITELSAKLPAEVDAYAELGSGYAGELWQAAQATLRGCCSGCVVPAALFKAMQVAAGVALPADSHIELAAGE